MDLGIAGRRALVCGASKGLGRGCAFSLAREGVAVTIVARTAPELQKTAAEIRSATGSTVSVYAGDITTPEGREGALAVCPDPDIVITNAGGPPPGDFREWDESAWITALRANMLSPIALIKLVVDGMIERRFGRIVNITSSSVKAPIQQLGLSNGARSGLTGFVAGVARTTVQYNVTINNLLPGTFDTLRLRGVIERGARAKGRDPEEERKGRLATIPAGRFGNAEEFGDACAYLCSAQASYITGQNLLIDGGAYPGTY